MSLRASAAASRSDRLGPFIDQVMTNLRQGIAQGYVAAAPIVAVVIEQIDRLLEKPPRESLFFEPARRDSDPAFATGIEDSIAQGILPSLRRARDVLANEVAPRACGAVGVSNIPRGEECYRARLAQAIGKDRDPREIHALGAEQLDRVEREMSALSQRSFGGIPVAAMHTMFRDDPRWHYKDRAEMLSRQRPRWLARKPLRPRCSPSCPGRT
jgi:uncharacterized protein (DUF885 family)